MSKVLTVLFEPLAALEKMYLNITLLSFTRGKDGKLKSKPRGSHYYDLATELAKMEDDARRFDAQGLDVYFSTCPTRVRKQGYSRISQADVPYVPAYILDMDTHEDPEKPPEDNIPADVPEAVKGLNALPFPPGLIVKSGHGVHAYWPLASPLSVSPEVLDSVKKRMSAFAKAVAGATGWLDLDACASEPARILRFPGTHNYKDPAHPLSVELVQESERRYEASELDAWARGVPLPQSKKRGSPPRERRPSGAALDYAPGGRYFLTDAQIWERIARKGALDAAAHNGDESAADLALCNVLAFYTGGDAARMDELFRASPRYRDKWDKRHAADGRTYGEMTIETALAGATKFYCGADYKYQALNPSRREDVERLRALYSEASGGEFQVRSFDVVAVKTDKNGNASCERLCDFIPRPLELIQRDDGLEKRLEYSLDGFDYRGRLLPAVNVPADRLESFRWVTNWPGAVIEPGAMKKDKLRAAIQKAARLSAKERTVYTHTGWRPENGWVYLHGGGAVGAEGISVELDGNLRDYDLSGAADIPVAEAVRASFDLLKIAPASVTLPLLATMYLAPACEWFERGGASVAHILTLQARTGSRKSTLSTLFLNHFGTGFDYQRPSANFNSTSNFVREAMFATKDAPLIIDDFHPSKAGRGSDNDKQTQLFQDICRAYGDHAARGRMNSDARGVQLQHPARGVGIVTAEFIPPLGESGVARQYIVTLGRDVDLQALQEAQQRAGKGVYARAMVGYLEWMAWEVNQDEQGFIKSLIERFYDWRKFLMDRLAANTHGRLPTAGAHLLTAFDLFLLFAQHVGVLTEEEALAAGERAGEVILAGLEGQGRSVAEQAP